MKTLIKNKNFKKLNSKYKITLISNNKKDFRNQLIMKILISHQIFKNIRSKNEKGIKLMKNN